MSHDEKHDHAKGSGGCCGGATASAGEPKAHSAPAGHHAHHDHAGHGAHGKGASECSSTDAKASAEVCGSTSEAPKPAPAAITLPKKADGGGCCSH